MERRRPTCSVAPGGTVSKRATSPGEDPRAGQKERPAACEACGARRAEVSEELTAKEGKRLAKWEDLSERDCALCAAAWFGSGRPAHIIFNDVVDFYNIVPYSEVYGLHPRTFNFDAQGRKIPSRNWEREHFLRATCRPTVANRHPT